MNKKILLLNTRFLLFVFFMLLSLVSKGQTTLFQFNFENSVSPNINNSCAVPVIGGLKINQPTYNNISPCGGSYMLSASNWKENEFYRISVNTSGFEKMFFSYCNRGDSGIGNFISYVSTDNGTTMIPIINSYTPSTTNSTVTSMELPVAASNKGQIFLYIWKDKSAATGALDFFIDNIILVGSRLGPAILTGNQYICSYGTNGTTTFSSSVSGGTWSSSNTGVATVNVTTGIVTGVGAGTATIIYTVCSGVTAIRDVYVANGPGGGVTSINGPSSLCQSTTATYTIISNAANFNHTWSYSGTGVTFVVNTDSRSAVATFASDATSGNVVVNSVNACGPGYGNGINVNVGAVPKAGTISGTTSVCIGSPQPNITFTNPQNYGVTMTYNINGGANQSIYVNANTTSNFGVSTATAGTFTYNLVSIVNGVGSPSCSSLLSGSATVTVVTGAGDQVTYGAGSWIGYVYANTNGGNPPTNAFSTTYRGYVTQTDNFDLNLGDGALSGPNVCGSYADNFAVRFKMNRNLPAGCYTFTVGGDDGYRLSLDGGLTYVVNNWGDHSYQVTSYTVYLSGNTNFVLEYFENGGLSRVLFSSVFSSLVTPTLGTVNHPNCAVTTGSIPLSGLPSSGTWTIIANPNTAGLTGLTGSGGTTTVAGLVAGTTYTFAVSNTTCTSPVTTNVVVNNIVTTTFNGSSWTSVPTILKIGVITASSTSPISISSDTELCSCTVSANTNVVVSSGITLKLQDRLTVNGSLTFEDNSSLVQINNAAVNTGNIIYKRVTNTGVRNSDYTYWSTPVSPLNLGGTGGISYNPSSLVGSIFYSYEVTAGSEYWKSESAASPMIVGKGYSIRGPGPISANALTQLEATFMGKPNNGHYPITGIHPDKAYLIGNPYPSALDANKFLTDNAGVIDGTLYFWTHSTKIGIGVPNPGTGVYAYTGDDYASYNLTGGTGTDGVAYPQGGVEAPSNPGSKPTGYIGAGQGFFAISNITISGLNEIVFNNGMRVGVGGIVGDNFQFFKTNSTKSKTTSTIEKNRVWLNMTNTQGAFKQLLVGYITGATNDYDNGYDGETFDGNEFIDLYSINQEKNFVIQGRALPFDANDEVPLGYRSVAEGDFSISIDEVDGIMQSQQVYIEDNLTNLVHDLKVSPYDFTTQAGTFDDRFVLRYTSKTLGVGDFDTTAMEVLVSVKNNQLKINSSTESIDKVFIYDVLGKKLYEKINVENKELIIPNLGSSEQVLIVKTVLQNGIVVTAKTIY